MPTTWTTDEAGNVTYMPIAGFSTAVLGAMLPALRIEMFASVEAMEGETTAIQIAMTPEQLRELGNALVKLSETLETKRALPTG